MERTFNTMRSAAQTHAGFEVVNYNYGKIVFTDDEMASFPEAVAEIVSSINGSSVSIKEHLGLDIKATVTGKSKNVVLIEGIGKLFESNPDEFIAIARLKADVTGPAATDMPVIASASSISTVKPAVTPRQPVAPKAVAAKPAVPKPSEARAAVPKPVAARTTVQKPASAKPAEEKAAPAGGTTTKFFTTIDAVLNDQGIAGRQDTVDLLVTDHGISPDLANKMIDLYVKTSKNVSIESDFIIKKD